jgi:hypothetical protein
MRCIILLSWSSTLSHKRHDFFGKKSLNIKCVFRFSFKTLVWNIFRYKNNRTGYCHKCENVFMWSTRYYCRILMKLEFSRQTFENKKNLKYRVSSKSAQLELSGFMRTDRQTDMTKLIVAFRNFANALKKIHSQFPSRSNRNAHRYHSSPRNTFLLALLHVQENEWVGRNVVCFPEC